jgi:membrane fusion protein (multidrug efflux system)
LPAFTVVSLAARICLRLVPLVLAGGLLVACESAPEEGAGPMGMMGGGGSVAVVVTPVVAETFVDSFTALGNAEANEAVDIVARVSSAITGIHFVEGQRVERGTLLVELDDREIAADFAVAKAAFDKVSGQYERSKSQGKTQVVSAGELEDLAADVRRAKADMQSAQARLDYCSIRAPIAGFVGLRNVSPGDLVGMDTVITTLDDTDLIKLNFSMPEIFLANIKTGMQVAAATSVYPNKTFSGEVISLDTRIDPVTRSITVIAVINNPDGILLPGMFMTVDLQRSRAGVLLIPEEALAPRSGRQFVFVVVDGVAEEREIKLGIRAPGRAEVAAGLQVGEQVVIEGIQKIRPGSQVTVQQAG